MFQVLKVGKAYSSDDIGDGPRSTSTKKVKPNSLDKKQSQTEVASSSHNLQDSTQMRRLLQPEINFIRKLVGDPRSATSSSISEQAQHKNSVSNAIFGPGGFLQAQLQVDYNRTDIFRHLKHGRRNDSSQIRELLSDPVETIDLTSPKQKVSNGSSKSSSSSSSNQTPRLIFLQKHKNGMLSEFQKNQYSLVNIKSLHSLL